MSQDTFPRRDVERSFRKFNDIVSDLWNADFRTWGNLFDHLMIHCEQDPVMKVVTEALLKNNKVDANKWYEECMASVGVIGSGRYNLPYDDEDRTALLYQFFRKIEKENIKVSDFCMKCYGTINYQEMLSKFNQELVLKFTRELSYRLDEIIEDVGDQTFVRRDSMIVFHHHDFSTTVHGNIQGSTVATGGSAIHGSTVTYNTSADLSAALKSLRPIVEVLAQNQRQAVQDALQTLVDSAETNSVPDEKVNDAIQTVAQASPTLGERLRDIGAKIGLSLASSAIFQGIKSVFGIH